MFLSVGCYLEERSLTRWSRHQRWTCSSAQWLPDSQQAAASVLGLRLFVLIRSIPSKSYLVNG
jgi:hypothetical protein